ncbi:MAG: hypothetical protein AMK73_09585 [Planctomycetes bacterium SM23_32]|nr:MAG: hypothetical protein AMK73_09585 [Planctomycetes bacterium SM23_32]
MTRETFRVTLQPEGRSVFVLRGTTLVEAAGQAGVILNQPCGGDGACGKCRVEVLQDPPPPTAADREHLSPRELEDGWRLACRLAVASDLVVSIPQETRFFEQMILAEGEGCRYPFQPNLRKKLVTVGEPTVEDQRSDLDRLKAAIGEDGLEAGLSLIRALPGILRGGRPHVTAVLEGKEIQWVEAGDTTDRIWGVAFDIGTTSVVGALMDLGDGRTAAVASRTNPQVHFGDDVVSRISYIENTRDGLEKLRRRLLTCLNEIIIELCESAGAEPESIYEATAVGNTTMSHIFLGVDPSPIAHAPYVAVLRESVDVKAREVGLEINRNANLHVLPNIAGFVGSDTVAVILASGIARDDAVQLAIDIGTNGEVVMGNRLRLVACSCAAGPAFEGARIRYGMRATEGAISKVVINEGVEVGVIGGGRPTGICGSGLVDAVAELLDAGAIDETGRIAAPAQAPALSDELKAAIVEFEDQLAVVLVDGAQSKTGRPILLTQRDVREVQLAKAAMRAGIEVVAEEFGVAPTEVARVLLAGGFGNFIRRSHAKRIGLLPPIRSERIDFIGNAAATGAKTVLACGDCRAEAERISRETEYVELASRPGFQARFAEAITFPPPG